MMVADALTSFSLVAFAVVICTVLLLIAHYVTKRQSTSLIICTGPSGSGKTVLCYRLFQECLRETVPSMQVNQLRIESRSGPQTIVDYPGHVSLSLGLASYLDQARHVLFVVDSSETSFSYAAKNLYSILTHPTISKCRIPVSVVCNKSDLENALPIDTIARNIENEINSIGDSLETMQDIDSTKQKTIALRKDGEPFKFSTCKNRISFGAVSGKTGNVSYVLEQL